MWNGVQGKVDVKFISLNLTNLNIILLTRSKLSTLTFKKTKKTTGLLATSTEQIK